MPEYAVLDKDTIKIWIMPNLSVAKRGFTTKFDLIEIVNSILYKLKSGCQWRMLPIGHLFTGEPPTWNTEFHHYRKWSKAGEWKSTFTEILSQNKDKVDLSLSHTPAYRGGEMVAYQGRKKRKTTNALFLSDRNGLPLALRQRQIGFPMQNYYKIPISPQ